MILYERSRSAGRIYVHPAEDSAVQIAAANLARDMHRICSASPAITHEWTDDVVVAAGTVEHLPLPSDVRTDAIRDEQGQPRWEGYLQQISGGVLYLAGNDRRGAVYAMYDLCERMGVSPWYDMADVPVKTRDVITLPDDWFLADWPSVQYRGIFLNDEEELDYWARTMNGEDTIGPKTYERIFELILRLKGNYIWPAMHVNAFNINEENGRLAQRMGIVTGTSHCDMLHRSNQNEWKHWVARKGYEGLKYDFTIPGQNRERLLEYWRESLEQNRESECCYTIGMRGIHDSGFVTANLTGDEQLSEEERMARKRALLEEIMTAQRGLIREVVPAENVPQSFVPYKEVLPIYDSGLKVPEDVTLIWVDDNHGYMRRYPNAQEQKRPGGHGVYYHSSYWAPPGMSWLFVCSTPLQHMGNELKKCYEQNIRRIWVDNVGALKPIEQDMEYFIRCGWDAGREDSVMLDANRFTREWIDRNFTGHHGAEVAQAYADFTQLGNVCKPEHMRSGVFSQLAYGDEAAARLHAMHDLVLRCEKVWKSLPEKEQDAFLQLVLMKMQAVFYIAASYYYADRSIQAFKAGAMRAADWNMNRSRDMDDLKRLLLHDYNDVMCGGKWKGILTPEDFPPPPLELYPACRPALTLGHGGLVLRLPQWGQPYGLCFDPYGAPRQWFELLSNSVDALNFTVTADEGITVSETEGLVAAEKRIFVRVDKHFRQGGIVIQAGTQRFEIPVTQCVRPAPTLPHYERDGVVHLRASDGQDAIGWRTIPHIGRAVGDAMEALPQTIAEHPASMRFDFETITGSEAELELIRFLTLNSTGDIRLRVTMDEGEGLIVTSATKDEYTGDWENAAVRCGEKLYLALGRLEPGRHSLLVEALDGYVTLCACNVYLRERQECVLGPGLLDGNVAIPDFDLSAMIALYGDARKDVPLPYVNFAGESFWTQDMLYAHVERQRPDALGAPRDWYIADGCKDVLSHLRTGVIRERDGHLAWECENALAQSDAAWMTAGADGLVWTHRQAETNGRTGLAMCMDPLPAMEEPAQPGPALHYRIRCEKSTVYHIWLLMKYDDLRQFRCAFALDGVNMRETAQVCHDHVHTYRTVYTWCWQKLVTLPVTAGDHVLSITAQGSGMAIDRIYMTAGNENPPLDAAWVENR